MREKKRDEFGGTERFEIVRQLGAGGMGVVYEARDRETDERVALKTLKHASGQSLYELKNEFRGLQNLQHRNLCGLGELLEDGGQWFFSMELLEGVDFLSYVRGASNLPAVESSPTADTEVFAEGSSDAIAMRGGKPPPCFDEARLERALIQLAHGLGELHRAGMVHRDIKPSNIIVTPDERLVLLDFGLTTSSAPEVDSHGEYISLGPESLTGPMAGTVSYMAPEQAAQSEVGPAADWYAVGTMIYEAITGVLPYRGSHAVVLFDKQLKPAPPPSSRVPGLAPELDSLCVKLLAIDPRARPTSDEVLRCMGVDLEGESHTEDSVAQPPIFVGRDEELAQLGAGHEQAVKGESSVVIIFGESGVGKSALIAIATARILACHPETVVLRSRCYERESVPFKAFDGVIDALSRHLRLMPETEVAGLMPENAVLLLQVFPVLGRVPSFARLRNKKATINDAYDLRARAFVALRELFLHLTNEAATIIVIDDWQWADRDSELLLKELLRAPGAPSLFLMISARPEAKEPLAQSTPFPETTRTVELAGLPQLAAVELSSLLAQRAGLSGVDAGDLAREAQGHPLYIDALVRYAAHSPNRGVSPRLDDALVLRVSEFAPDTRRVAELVCVAGEPLSQALLRTAAQIERGDFAAILAKLRVANTIRGRGARDSSLVEPYHDRVREAVTATLDTDNYRTLNERLAQALEDSGNAGRPELLLRYLEAAGQPDKAAAQAIRAAERASQALAFSRSAEYYRAALRLGSHDEAEENRLKLALARALGNAGRGPEAAEAFLAVSRGGNAQTRRECQREAAEQWLKSGYLAQGLEAMSALLKDIGVAMPGSSREALISLLKNRVKLRLGGYRCTIKPLSEIPADAITRIEVLHAVSCGLNMVDTFMGANFQGQALLLALRAGSRLHVGRMLVVESAQVALTGKPGDYRRAYRLLEMVTELSAGDDFLDAWQLVGQGAADYMCSKLRSGEEKMARAEAALQKQPRVSWEISQLRVFRLSNLRRLGALAQMHTLLEGYMRDAASRGDLYAQTSFTLCCARVWLRDDEPAAMRRMLDDVSWTPPEEGYHLQHWYAFSAEVELELYTGKTRDMLNRWQHHFVSLKKALLLRIMIVNTEALWIKGRLALASLEQAQPGARKKLMKTARGAVRDLSKQKDDFGAMLSLLLAATVARHDGDRQEAVRALRRAIAASAALGARLHEGAARRTLGKLLANAEGATLVAEGESMMRQEGVANPEAMSRVYLSTLAEA